MISEIQSKIQSETKSVARTTTLFFFVVLSLILLGCRSPSNQELSTTKMSHQAEAPGKQPEAPKAQGTELPTTVSVPVLPVPAQPKPPEPLPPDAEHRICDTGTPGPGIISGQKLTPYGALGKRVVLVVSELSAGEALCTGTLISKDVILTAAHCFEKDNVRSVVIFSTDVMCDLAKKTVKIGIPLIIRRNELFKADQPSVNDLALVRLKQEAPEGTAIMPLSFADDGITESSKLYAVGFGKTVGYNQEDKLDPMLRFTPIIARSHLNPDELIGLKKILGDEAFASKTPFWFVENIHNGVCAGDSGGPLINYDHGFVEQAGVANFVFTITDGDPCIGTGAYVKLATQRAWLHQAYQGLGSTNPNPF